MSHTKNLLAKTLEKVETSLDQMKNEIISKKNPLLFRGQGYWTNVINNPAFQQFIQRDKDLFISYQGKQIGTGIISEIILNSDKFDQAYEILSNDESKNVFNQFISYHVAYSIIGEMAFLLSPPLIHPDVMQDQNEQYRYSDIVSPAKGDIVIDAGAYNGDTALWFLKYIGEEGKVYSFEPFDANFDILNEKIRINNIKNISPIKSGLWDEEKSLNIIGFGDGDSSFLAENGGNEIKVISLDKFVKDNDIQKVDFIKMDIEGAEVKGLKGASETIKKFKPKLAICVYHSKQDIYEIIDFINSQEQNYQFYLRHNSFSWFETVLYAKSYCHDTHEDDIFNLKEKYYDNIKYAYITDNEKDVANTIKASGLFDVSFYQTTYVDVTLNGIDPIIHYVRFGANEGRKPNKWFDTRYYMYKHKDVRESGINPFYHYIVLGKNEGRTI